MRLVGTQKSIIAAAHRSVFALLYPALPMGAWAGLVFVILVKSSSTALSRAHKCNPEGKA